MTYQIFAFSARYTSKMEHEELKTVPMLWWKHVDRLLEVSALLLYILNVCSISG